MRTDAESQMKVAAKIFNFEKSISQNYGNKRNQKQFQRNGSFSFRVFEERYNVLRKQKRRKIKC